MHPNAERRLFQICVALACLVPIAAGGAGLIGSAAMLRDVATPLPPDLDSHYRYLSGLLLGIGLAFATCIPRIEKRGARFQTLGAIVIIGGVSRLLSLVESGPPSQAHVLALTMEIGAVPLLMLWQARVEGRCREVTSQTS